MTREILISGQALFLLFGDERRQDHHPAAVRAQLPRARHAGGDPDPAAGRSRRPGGGGLAQVWQLSEIVDWLRIPVLCYGLRTDFRGELFEGSQYLLAWADELQEIKTICHSGKKATMNVRIDAQGHALQDGPQVEIGGNERYVSVSRAEFKRVMRGEGRIEPLQAVLPL